MCVCEGGTLKVLVDLKHAKVDVAEPLQVAVDPHDQPRSLVGVWHVDRMLCLLQGEFVLWVLQPSMELGHGRERAGAGGGAERGG